MQGLEERWVIGVAASLGARAAASARDAGEDQGHKPRQVGGTHGRFYAGARGHYY